MKIKEYDSNNYTTGDDFCRFMKDSFDFLKHNAEYNICSDCGGTGLSAVMCCNGRYCGCFGLPIDFLTICPKCKINHFQLFEEHY